LKGFAIADAGASLSGTDTYYQRLSADLLEDMSTLMLKHGNEIDVDAVMLKHGNVTLKQHAGAPASSLLEEALRRRTAVLGLQGASGPVLVNLRLVKRQEEAASSVSGNPLACKIFQILDLCRRGLALNATSAYTLSQVVSGMKASASAGKASELSCVQEWGAGAVSALLQRDGAEALKTTKQDEVIKTLLGAAESYPTSLSVSQEVCAALMSVINVGGPTEGLAHLPKRLADGMVQALSVALDVHKEDDRVQELALQVMHRLVQDDSAGARACIDVRLLLQSQEAVEKSEKAVETIENQVLVVFEILETLVNDRHTGDSALKSMVNYSHVIRSAIATHARMQNRGDQLLGKCEHELQRRRETRNELRGAASALKV
jgi:hypothetical protein